MIKILFVCIHNSARSQIAETFANFLGKGKLLAYSAGIEPGILNPYVVKAMKEIGLDISNNKTKGIDTFLKSNHSFDYVITVCDATSGERCPIFPGKVKRLHWEFDDPSAFKGTEEEIMVKVREVRDKIKENVVEFLNHI
ncbi:MAG: arsenate reductase ArsC [Exilispira sp.]|jgi:arsenate reductase|nr:arsenate reductase ArsC [Exilispira sp.]